MKKMEMQTKDLIQENIEAIKHLFPEVITEGKDSQGIAREVIDFERLKEILGDEISTSPEHYEFTWVGKREASRLAATPISKTLRPCKEESKDWNSTENLYIEGDNLDVLKLLQESYLGKVKMIYIDPPYNTGKDFVYRDNFHQSQEDWKEQTTLVDEDNNRLAVNPDSSGRFHSDWCTMMYPRLRLARNLLRDDGVMFISIDDNEVSNLKQIGDEVFGEKGFVGIFPWRKRTAKSDVPFGISQDYEWVLAYAKTINFFACLEGGTRKYYQTEDFPDRPWRIHDLTKQTTASERPNSFFTIVDPRTQNKYPANINRTWAITEDTFTKYHSEGRIVFPGDYDFLRISKPALRYFKEDDLAKAGNRFGYIAVSTYLPAGIGMTQDGTKEITSIFNKKVFGFPKPISLVRYFLKMTTDITSLEDDIILDFFSGSATTAHAVMQLNAEDGGNRKFIMVQVPERCDQKSEAYKDGYATICEIGKERIRRAGEKIKKEIEEGKVQLELDAEDKKVPDIGFRVLKLDTSNMTDVYYGAAELEQKDLFDSESNIKSDRTELDILFGIMLDWGLPLSLPYKKETIGNTDIHNVEEGALIACFADNISEDVIIAIAKKQATKVVFKDSCFSSSVDRINVEQLFKHYDPTFVSNSDKIRVI